MRKKTYKKRSAKRRRTVLRPRKSLPAPPGTMMMKRKLWIEHWQPNTTTVSGFWRQFNWSVSQLADFTSIQALFDQYKICRLKLDFIPRFDSFAGNDTTDTTPPGVTAQPGTQVHVSYDTYTTLAPSGTYGFATLNTFLEQGRIKRFYGNRPFTVYYRPTITQTVGNVSALNWRSPTWLPTTSGGILHHGPTVFCHDSNFSGTFGNSFDVFITCYVMFKNPK